ENGQRGADRCPGCQPGLVRELSGDGLRGRRRIVGAGRDVEVVAPLLADPGPLKGPYAHGYVDFLAGLHHRRPATGKADVAIAVDVLTVEREPHIGSSNVGYLGLECRLPSTCLTAGHYLQSVVDGPGYFERTLGRCLGGP